MIGGLPLPRHSVSVAFLKKHSSFLSFGRSFSYFKFNLPLKPPFTFNTQPVITVNLLSLYIFVLESLLV